MVPTPFRRIPNGGKKTTVYHIYLRSFYDANGDGIGDIQGVIEKLDYLADLGFETIWVSPFTQSPQRDFGYDISDYLSISRQYGDMPLFEQLVQEVSVNVPRALIAETINVIVFIAGRGRTRRVEAIARVTGLDANGYQLRCELVPVPLPSLPSLPGEPS